MFPSECVSDCYSPERMPLKFQAHGCQCECSESMESGWQEFYLLVFLTFTLLFSMKKTLLFLFLLASSFAFAQTIKVQGKIVNALNNKPIKASIRYKSYPTGGISGMFTDSIYSFNIFGSSKYQITVEAEGFIDRTVIIDPKEAMLEQIVRDISMTSIDRAITLDHLIFETGRATIKPTSYLALDEVVAMMKENLKIVIQLEGHTDVAGDTKKNMELSKDRVEAVKKYIVSKGILKDRIKTKAFGGTQPLSLEKTEDAKALNRRVEMRVLRN